MWHNVAKRFELFDYLISPLNTGPWALTKWWWCSSLEDKWEKLTRLWLKGFISHSTKRVGFCRFTLFLSTPSLTFLPSIFENLKSLRIKLISPRRISYTYNLCATNTLGTEPKNSGWQLVIILRLLCVIKIKNWILQ